MINQELNIAILEMFDEIKAMEIYVNYKKCENEALENKEVKELIKKINELADLTYNITYQPSLDEILAKVDMLTNELNTNDCYAQYLLAYDKLNEYIKELAKLVFQDIAEIESGCFCAH